MLMLQSWVLFTREISFLTFHNMDGIQYFFEKPEPSENV